MLLIVVGILIATGVVKDVEAWLVERGILGVVVLEQGILDQVDTGVDIPGPGRRRAGVPVAVTFCPLCVSAIAFKRTLPSATVTTFGVSGGLIDSNIIMFDRSTEGLWQQSTGRALTGDVVSTGLALPGKADHGGVCCR